MILSAVASWLLALSGTVALLVALILVMLPCCLCYLVGGSNVSVVDDVTVSIGCISADRGMSVDTMGGGASVVSSC